MTRIKVCGLVEEADARHAAECGADFLGFVLAESPRRADPAAIARWLPALRRAFPALRTVGVFIRPSVAEVNAAVQMLELDLVQVHGAEPAEIIAAPRPLILAAGPGRLAEAAAARPWAVLADRVAGDGGGGTGLPLDWKALAKAAPAGVERLFLAGGLDAACVGEAIRLVRPWAVDASSRLETGPGRKDHAKVAAFCGAVRTADGAEGRREP